MNWISLNSVSVVLIRIIKRKGNRIENKNINKQNLNMYTFTYEHCMYSEWTSKRHFVRNVLIWVILFFFLTGGYAIRLLIEYFLWKLFVRDEIFHWNTDCKLITPKTILVISGNILVAYFLDIRRSRFLMLPSSKRSICLYLKILAILRITKINEFIS